MNINTNFLSMNNNKKVLYLHLLFLSVPLQHSMCATVFTKWLEAEYEPYLIPKINIDRLT